MKRSTISHLKAYNITQPWNEFCSTFFLTEKVLEVETLLSMNIKCESIHSIHYYAIKLLCHKIAATKINIK